MSEDASIFQLGFYAVVTLSLPVFGWLGASLMSAVAKNREGLSQASLDMANYKTHVAENYATKNSLTLLFQETTRTNKEGLDRVEKQMDEQKVVLSKQAEKIDGVKDIVTKFGGQIMQELSKKT